MHVSPSGLFTFLKVGMAWVTANGSELHLPKGVGKKCAKLDAPGLWVCHRNPQ